MIARVKSRFAQREKERDSFLNNRSKQPYRRIISWGPQNFLISDYSSTEQLTISIRNSEVKIFYDSKFSSDAMVWFSLFDYSMDNANIL